MNNAFAEEPKHVSKSGVNTIYKSPVRSTGNQASTGKSPQGQNAYNDNLSALKVMMNQNLRDLSGAGRESHNISR